MMGNTLPRSGTVRKPGPFPASMRLTGPQTLFIAPLALWFALSYMVRSWWAAQTGERD
jgi:hypothetical protein